MFEQLDDCLNSIQVDARETALAVKTLTERLDKVEIIGSNGFGKINDATTAARKASQMSREAFDRLKELADTLEENDEAYDEEFTGISERFSELERKMDLILATLGQPRRGWISRFLSGLKEIVVG